MGGRGHAQFIGAAGQHYVAYCLGVRGIHAGITLGNVPDVDLIVAKHDGSAALSLQVKTSRRAYCPNHFGKKVCQWPVGEAAVNRCSDSLWYAFVDLQESDVPSWNPRVFLVPSLWVGKFVKEDWPLKLYMLPIEAWPQCLERWDRINAFFNDETETLNWCRHIPLEAADWSQPPVGPAA